MEEKLAAHNINIYSVSPLGDVRLVQTPITQSDTITKSETGLTKSVRQRKNRKPSRRSLHKRGTLSRMKSFIERPCPDEYPRGIVVHCDDLECIFEFKLYRYKGRYYADSQPIARKPVAPEQTSREHSLHHDDDRLVDIPTDVNPEQIVAEITSPTIPSSLQPPLQPSQSKSSQINPLEASSSDNRLTDSARSSPSLQSSVNDPIQDPQLSENDDFTYIPSYTTRMPATENTQKQLEIDDQSEKKAQNKSSFSTAL